MDETSEVTTEVKEEIQEKPVSPMDWPQSEWFKEWEKLAQKDCLSRQIIHNLT